MKNIIKIFQINYLVPVGYTSQLSSTYSRIQKIAYFSSIWSVSNLRSSTLNCKDVLMFCFENPSMFVYSMNSSSVNSLDGFSALIFWTSGKIFSILTLFTSYPHSLIIYRISHVQIQHFIQNLSKYTCFLETLVQFPG